MMEALFEAIRDMATPSVWSAGVALARNSEIQEMGIQAEDERAFRIIQQRRDPVVQVSLSEANESWQCDCNDNDDPCRHVIATIIAVRQSNVVPTTAKRGVARTGSVVHAFTRSGGKLSFTRYLVWGDERREVSGSLAAAQRAIKPGEPAIALSRDEEAIDHVLPSRKSGVLDPKTMRHLLSVLSRLAGVELDGVWTSVSSRPLKSSLELIDDGDGFRLRTARDSKISEIFENGVALADGVLCPVADTALSGEEWQSFQNEGRRYDYRARHELVATILPHLEGRIGIEIKTKRLPRLVSARPRIVLETIGDQDGTRLTIVPHLVYGEPAIAEVFHNRVEFRDAVAAPERDRVEESRLVRDLQSKLFLRLDQAKVLEGEEAIRFAEQLKGWEVSGSGRTIFTPAAGLSATLTGDPSGLNLTFSTPDGRTVKGEAVVEAWQRAQNFVRLSDGGWGELPRAWLAEHREALLRIISAKDGAESASTAGQRIADVQELCDSLGVPCPRYFETLRSGLKNLSELPKIALPDDINATLRPYQEVGVNWLGFLRAHSLGALLADDMGLGKTLQAICTLQGRTLVIAPTSVLHGWEEQVQRFRPSLRVCRYHGPSRSLDNSADIVVTTYAILRLDVERLTEMQWDTVILDESQIIKNPDSQVARAAFRLRGNFRITLSGTPVENSLEDLWSQLHFLNPGLLGGRSEFERRFAAPIRGGDTETALRLRKRVAPFIMRRLKHDVARELPPKTEVVLECELDARERVLYDSILGASRGAVAETLAEGGSLLSVLEILLRLRQACCHSALVPGHEGGGSSKVKLLIESLRNSVEQGHRALIFSQWTSLLDLLEPELRGEGITFARIDGSTTNREDIVREFQSENGPNALLLSLKAGGVGLNLTAADHVYILDPWWNPAVEDQAADRAYRIGQENPVLVHRLVARDTIEERVLALQHHKRQLLSAAIGEGQVGGLSRDEILSLLA